MRDGSCFKMYFSSLTKKFCKHLLVPVTYHFWYYFQVKYWQRDQLQAEYIFIMLTERTTLSDKTSLDMEKSKTLKTF